MKNLYKYLIFGIWIFAIVVFFRELYIYAFIEEMGIQGALMTFGEEMQKILIGFGIFTPILFILLYAIRPLILFPASIMTITSVFLFGLYGGFTISYVGEMFSSMVAFFVGKYFGENLGLTQKIETTKMGSYFKGNAFLSVFLLRLIPVFPFDFVNYVSGIFKLPIYPYILGTALGVLPGLSIYIFLGYSLMHTEYLISAIALFIALSYISNIFKTKWKQNSQKKNK